MKTFLPKLLLCLCTMAAMATNAQTPKLNSHPSASAVVFLDFDGHYVTGTSWNSNGPINCDGSNLNATQITEVFNRVAEDYRPFNINITTDSTKYWAAPVTKRMRVVLTISSSWYGTAGGVAFINSFNWGDNTPCFVFTALHNYKVKNISEAASHEAGHTLGLRHQSSYDASCNKTSEYNAGIGSGETAWAPIMGNGYYRNLTLWHYGSNPYGCNSMQDDLSIITGATNGIGFRTDDHPNLTSGATTLSFTNNRFQNEGIIESPEDKDLFKLIVPTMGRLQLQADPFAAAMGNLGSNIDLEVAIIANNQVIAAYNPQNILGVTIDTILNAGTYYVQVRGSGNSYAPNYASLGSYSFGGSFTAGNPLPVHKLELKGVTRDQRHLLDWEIVADENVVEQTVEISTNGRTFEKLSQVTAASRTYQYLPSKNNTVHYRLSVLFDNGRTYYSNIISLKNTNNSRPQLITNVIYDRIVVNSIAGFDYSIHDAGGRIVSRGRLMQGMNNISAANWASGIYIVRYHNGGDVFTEKIIKH